MFFDELLDETYCPNEYPALDALCGEWSETRPFAGLRILVATPIFRNTMVEYRALMAGGADLAIGRATHPDEDEKDVASMPCDKKILAYLVENGMKFYSVKDVVREESDGKSFDLILDCAGQFAACHPKIGFVELTRSGVHFYENVKHPVYVADSGIVKRIETSLGTGDGYFRALVQLGYSDFESKKLLVFGSGKVGSGIALQGLSKGCSVTVVTDTTKKGTSTDFCATLEQNDIDVLDCRDFIATVAAIQSADYIVTATGVKEALVSPILTQALLATKAKLSNMGVEDEYGKDVPAEKVLNGKAPLNFILEEPTHLKYIETSMALHAALGECLVRDSRFEGLKEPPAELEEKLLMTTIQNGVIGAEICGKLGLSPEF